ncbi:hypothetical protein GYMLUDRAFT_256420 [Collybiopsis luxurians FD-317 M1]|nr:hypothetical protein GYMLUDRAFT_256420 [Collybiopsis luxurians FD-317 M1]
MAFSTSSIFCSIWAIDVHEYACFAFDVETNVNVARVQFGRELHRSCGREHQRRSAMIQKGPEYGHTSNDDSSNFVLHEEFRYPKPRLPNLQSRSLKGAAECSPLKEGPKDSAFAERLMGRPSPISDMTSASSSRSSPMEVSGKSSSPAHSPRLDYSYKSVHKHAIAARARHVALNTCIGSSTGSCEPNTQDCYIRRAQERIKRQQPAQRPRLEDTIDVEAQNLATAISSRSASCSTSSSKDSEEFSFSFDPHFPEDMQELTKFEGLSISEVSLRDLLPPRWSSGWDDLLEDLSADDVPIVHAPRAVRPMTKVVEALESALARV